MEIQISLCPAVKLLNLIESQRIYHLAKLRIDMLVNGNHQIVTQNKRGKTSGLPLVRREYENEIRSKKFLGGTFLFLPKY